MNYRVIAFGSNGYGFWNEPKVFVTPEIAIKTGHQCLGSEEVYGFVLVEVNHEDWRVMYECSYGCEYTVYMNQWGSIKVKKGRDNIVLV